MRQTISRWLRRGNACTDFVGRPTTGPRALTNVRRSFARYASRQYYSPLRSRFTEHAATEDFPMIYPRRGQAHTARRCLTECAVGTPFVRDARRRYLRANNYYYCRRVGRFLLRRHVYENRVPALGRYTDGGHDKQQSWPRCTRVTAHGNVSNPRRRRRAPYEAIFRSNAAGASATTRTLIFRVPAAMLPFPTGRCGKRTFRPAKNNNNETLGRMKPLRIRPAVGRLSIV